MADYQVPQFIEDESRLIGPFTLTQIGILVIGCGSAFIFYKLFKSFIGIPLAVIILFLTGMLTFSQMNNMPLYKMIVPILKHFILPKSYQ
ncbi:MAG TPA: PrgI family protein [Candidatus Paceibacterota bacterium]|nr:PrgI family protein [Candidatus Paceibacterota bacterium]HRZ29801.1 PrgI family protein [Candidatus Paceibacterota bacterium]